MSHPSVAPLIRSFVNGLINSNKVMVRTVKIVSLDSLLASSETFCLNGNTKMFSKETCPFCMRAKDLLEDLDIAYKAYEFQFGREDRVVESHEVRRRLAELTNQTTVPNIFINGKHLGGSTDLIDANNSGKLQKMLEIKNPNWVDPKTVKPIPAGWSEIDKN
ncbi:Glutaredoxin [Umbelopsis nana]